ncbi:hypothetical protein BASA50_007638 [Batrachochytrium salamandrivorans]|uniref:Wiskott-Aldrich syndrome protein family member n=1 Tax=Batrachochytrium salamandrivorans TaxID=1357716 RepID=A0ABQ8F6F3_9FUNG|nr:hypothetical protein BASA62_008986 [Batrachochytrium salamandrivorans]KAH6564949.1 hypothetical protein BASA60_010081 [Batrachochytrium salamandrivorans]KAH6593056.1 hypothetical protein BASA50_007638 [Batrachochytrium salamandrivorans]KAH6598328.1 hypothetical protein BASA61_002914 [Batrachochytrium salamandrivorans]KAH9251246.1 hypothetical protein BASA81_010942 [Batrachochytrium salamandrivorans]
MSLPKRVLTAGSPSVPQFPAPSTAAVLGVPEPMYIPALRQVHMMQLTRLFDQLAELSSYANELFIDLANKTLSVTERINNVGSMIASAHADMGLIEEEISAADIKKSLQRERFVWKSESAISSNFFVKKTQSASIIAAYNRCRPAPPLGILDEYRSDGQQCMKFYSYPDYFVEEWRNLMMKDQDGKKAKRKAKGAGDIASRRSIRLKRISQSGSTSGGQIRETLTPDGHFINITLSSNARQHVEVSSDTHLMGLHNPSRGTGFDMGRQEQSQASMLQNIFEAHIPITKPPPPPPPPPPMIIIPTVMEEGETPSDLLSSIAPTLGGVAPTGTPATPSVNFLADIRTLQFKLKKTDTPEDGSPLGGKKKVGADSDEVTAILMRRVALEMSDSEDEDDEDDEDWG